LRIEDGLTPDRGLADARKPFEDKRRGAFVDVSDERLNGGKLSFAADDRRVTRQADVRYAGQGHEIRIDLPDGVLGPGSMPAINLGMRGPGGVADAAEQGIFCPSCNTAVSRNWATCPHCGYRKFLAPDLIRRRCTTCGTELQKDWNACPYCSTRIDAPLTAPAPGPAQFQHQTTAPVYAEAGSSV